MTPEQIFYYHSLIIQEWCAEELRELRRQQDEQRKEAEIRSDATAEKRNEPIAWQV
jgi:rRNA-processing protein FCF1